MKYNQSSISLIVHLGTTPIFFKTSSPISIVRELEADESHASPTKRSGRSLHDSNHAQQTVPQQSPNSRQRRDTSRCNRNLHDCYNVIDLEDHSDALGGQLEGARVHEYRLDHMLRKHVTDGALAHVDSCARGVEWSGGEGRGGERPGAGGMRKRANGRGASATRQSRCAMQASLVTQVGKTSTKEKETKTETEYVNTRFDVRYLHTMM